MCQDDPNRVNPPRGCENRPRRIVILRALQLGDLLCTVPAFRALRAAMPRAEITLIGLPWARSLVERYAYYFNDFIEFPGYPGLGERPPQLDQIPEFLKGVQSRRFDLALQMHGSGTITNPLTVQFGAAANAGYFVPGQFCPDQTRFLPYPEGVPEVWRHLRLMQHLGIPLQGEELEFPVHDEDRQALHAIDAAAELRPGSYVCIHAGARAAFRRWPVERFAAVADVLTRLGLRIVLTGSAEEMHRARAVAAAMRVPSINLAGRTTLGSLAALLDGARLLICNDTGVSHLAAALRVPSVVVFHHLSEQQGWPPQDRQLHRVVCGVEEIEPSAVIVQAESLLALSPPHHRSNDRMHERNAAKELPCAVSGS